MIIVTLWTKAVTNTRVLASGLITIVNIFIWYYVLETIISNLDKFSLVLLYASGCAIGTMLGTYYSSREDKRSRLKNNLKKLAREVEQTQIDSTISETKLS